MEQLLSFLDLGAAEGAVIKAARVILILLLAWLLQRIATRLIAAFHRYMAQRDRDGSGRIGTVEQVLKNVATELIAIIAGSLVLGELGISVLPILATAGVAGIAIGFGAQSLIKDYFNGFFLLLEDQLRHGDVVECEGENPCPLSPGCRLRGALRQAQEAFYASLDPLTLADVTADPTGPLLLQIGVGRPL